MDQLNSDSFVCPACCGRLRSAAATLVCDVCSAAWPVVDGVPDFRSARDRYWGEYPAETMDRLLDVCRSKGWQEGLKEFFQARDPDYFEYLTDKRRANWSYLISLPEAGRVLDAGCGWGALTFPLADRFGDVYGLDIVPQRSAFVKMRAQQDNVRGVLPVCGQLTRLPFPDDFFDLAVLNGVLEWIPSTEDGDPLKVQEAALREVCRVLRPGGVMYLAIENRWAAINFLGFRDAHSGLRFAPVLPRALANIYSRIARGKDFREFTYTYAEHRKILRRTGFGRACFYAPLPTYRRFYYFLPVEDSRRVRFFLEKLVWSRNRLQRFFVAVTSRFRLYRFVKHFVPDFSIVAQKEVPVQDAGVCRDMILHQGVERVTQFLFEAGRDEPTAVLKVYQEERTGRWDKMCDVMRNVHENTDPLLVRSVPQILVVQKGGGQFAVRESYVDGISLQRYAERRSLFWKKEFIGHLEAVTAWVSAFHRACVVGKFVFEQESVRHLLGDIAVHIPAGTFSYEPCRTTVPAVIRHRDLQPANILLTPRGVRIVDWDRFAMQGLPLLDLMEFILCYVHAHCMWQEAGMHLEPVVFRRYLDFIYLRDNALSRAVRSAVARYGEAMGLVASQQQFLLACWTSYMFCSRPPEELCVFKES